MLDAEQSIVFPRGSYDGSVRTSAPCARRRRIIVSVESGILVAFQHGAVGGEDGERVHDQWEVAPDGGLVYREHVIFRGSGMSEQPGRKGSGR